MRILFNRKLNLLALYKNQSFDMKKVLLSFLFLVTITFSGIAQLLSYNIDFPTAATNNFQITVDATKGNQGLLGHTATDVYVHTGVITDKSTTPSDWKYVKFGGIANLFTTAWGPLNAPSVGTNKWRFTISDPNGIRGFYGVPADEKILKITFLFRSGNGAKKQANIDGSDMYIPVYEAGAFAVKFTSPAMQPMFNPIPEPINITTLPSSIPVTAISSKNANLTIRFDGTSIGNIPSGTSVSGNANVTTRCDHRITLEGIDGATNLKDTVNFFLYPTTIPTGARPVGRKDGVTFENGNTEAVFILYAPGKQKVALVGDFNSWTPTCATLLTKDNDYFWVRLTGLTPGKKYAYQYVVDETIRVVDPYTELILDPWNDQFIPSFNFPNIPAYPTGLASRHVGVISPGEAQYNWTTPVSYGRPDKKDLMVYEVLVRDFLATQSFKTLKDTLGYIKRLGFNAIELMPVNEFDGNNSWGYNPAHFFAVDKMYGTKNDLKAFIDKAHEMGIAVIVDVVFNHATGDNPLAAMWWNSTTNKPAANNPYFNVDANHPFGFFNDFNHSKTITRDYVKRYIEFWLTEFRVDGFRWDLSKGFTPEGFVADWNAYIQWRIDLWQEYYDKMNAVSPGSYCILEHLGNESEEAELAKREMMLWGEMHAQFKQNVIGFPTAGAENLNSVHWKNRGGGWNDSYLDTRPHLVTYAVSHDKERIMNESLFFGNTSQSGHNVRTENTALRRSESMGGFLMSFPGPKMIWQFDELGYDVSIMGCSPTWAPPAVYPTNESCKTDPKPARWNYYTFGPRMRIFETYAAMARLRNLYKEAFRSPFLAGGTNLSGNVKTIVVDANAINTSGLKYVAVCNFDVVTQNPTVSFPGNGTWFDYLNGGSINVTTGSAQVSLPPGVFKIYLNQNVSGGVVTSLRDVIANKNEFTLRVSPNPVVNSTTVQYELPRSGQVNLQLINVQGQVVASRNMGFQLKGIQTYQLNPSQLAGAALPSGQYILQVRVDNLVRYEKIMLQQKP